MSNIRYLIVLILAFLLTIPIFAQDTTPRSIQFDETVGGIFSSNNVISHTWELELISSDTLQINLRRIGGIFDATVTLIDPNGNEVDATFSENNAFGQVLRFQEPLSLSGTYQIIVAQVSSDSDGILTQSEYSLAVDYLGQIPSDFSQDLRPMLPDLINFVVPELFTGNGLLIEDIGIELFGDASVEQIEINTQANRYLVNGTRRVEIANAEVVSGFVNAIAFAENGVALRTNSGAIFYTTHNISNVAFEEDLLSVTLDDGRVMTSDYFSMASIVAVDDFVFADMLEGQHLFFDANNIRLSRRGGIAGEGANIEAILVIESDAARIETDFSAWDILAILESTLQIVYSNDLLLRSDELIGAVFSEAGQLDIRLNHTEDEFLQLSVDPFAMGEVSIEDRAVQINLFDGRSVSEALSNLTTILYATQVLRLDYTDNRQSLIVVDETRVDSPSAIVIDENALASQDGFRPQNFNNLGMTVTDLHPEIDMSMALEPVNRFSGNFVYPVQDYTVPSHALALDWSRTYNSLAAANQTPDYYQERYLLGHLGNGWRHSYQYELDIRQANSGEVQLILADGSRHIFGQIDNSGTLFRSGTLLSWTIEQRGGFSGDWVAYDADGIQYVFDTIGRLQSITHSQGYALLFSPIPKPYLERFGASGGFFVTEDYGRRLEVYTDADNRIVMLRGVQGRSIHYSYEQDNLVAVDYLGEDYAATYAYDANGFLTVINDVNSPYAQDMVLEYNSFGQVIRYSDYPNTDLSQSYQLDYGESTTQTWTVGDGEERVMSWTFDSNYRLIRWILPDPNWVYQWNYVGDSPLLAEILQPTLTRLRFTYDEFGYLTRFADPLFSGSVGAYDLVYETGDNFTRRLVTIDAPNISNWQTFEYDQQNRLTAIVRAVANADGGRQTHSTSYEYDEATGQLAQIIEPSPSEGQRTIAFGYDHFGYLAVVRIGSSDELLLGESAQSWQFLHDGVGRLLTVVEDDGRTSFLQWQVDRNLLTGISVDEAVYTYAYDERDNLISYHSPQVSETYAYDAANNLVLQRDRLEREMAYTYDAVGNLLSIMQADGGLTTYSYDVMDRLQSSTLANGATNQYATTIDQERIVYSVTNSVGVETEYIYNSLGRLRQVNKHFNDGFDTLTYTLTYNSRGNLIAITDNFTSNLTMAYNLLGNPISSTINSTAQTEYLYNSANLLSAVIDPTGEATEYSYDMLGNVNQTRLANGSTLDYAYDAVGNLRTIQDALGSENTFAYDTFGRLISETNTLGHQTRYSYDDAGNLTVVLDPLGNEITYAYDDANRLISWSNTSGGGASYGYNDLDQVIRVAEANGLQTTFTYDAVGNVVAVTQPEDREFLYGWDSIGRLISETNPIGQTTLFAYNTIGELGRLTNPLGNVQQFGWFGNGRIVSYNVSNGASYQYSPDEVGRLDLIVDRGAGNNTDLSYDEAGNITRIEIGSSSNPAIHRYSYDAMGNVIEYFPPTLDIPYSYTYDANNRLLSIRDPEDLVTHYTYDEIGNITGIVYAAETEFERSENFAYDAAGNLIASLTLDGINRQYSYDSNNRLIQMVEFPETDNERIYGFGYDVQGRLITYTEPNGQMTTYSYDLFGNLAAIEQTGMIDDVPVSLSTRYEYDAVDNLITIQRPDEQEITMTYNSSGQRVRYIDAANNSWSFSYDDNGNVSQVSNPLGDNQFFNFDAANRISQIIFEQGAMVDFVYDDRGNLTRIELPPMGNDVVGEEVDYDFDSRGNLVGMGNRGASNILFSRNQLGLIAAIDTPNNAEVQLSYDVFGRITEIVANGQTISRNYTDSGQLASISDGLNQQNFVYDAFGQLVETAIGTITETESGVEVSPSYVFSTDFDDLGNILTRNLSDFGTITYRYDDFNRPTEITITDINPDDEDDIQEVIEITYDANGWRTGILRSNGIATNYIYNDNGQVQTIVHSDTNAENQRLLSFAYEYDAVGSLIRVTRSDNWAILYSYDEAQQLISERWLDASNQIVYSVNYAYDASGNRIEQSVQMDGSDQFRTEFDYNRTNQLISETRGVDLELEDRFSIPVMIALVLVVPMGLMIRHRPQWMPMLLILFPLAAPAFQAEAPMVDYDYDSNGNLIRETFDDGVNGQIDYGYDDFNRLIIIIETPPESDELLTTEIQYDLLGQVSQVIENEIAYQFIYDAFGLVAIENTVTGELLIQYAPTPNETMLVQSDADTFWTIDNGLGQLAAFSDNSENLRGANSSFTQNAFGEVIVPQDDDFGMSPFIEQIYLPQSGIMLMGVRAYHPRLGRFLQRDWVRHDPRGNLYTYAYNSPTNFSDPSGMIAEAASEGIMPDLEVIDPMDFVVTPTIADLPDLPDVAELQARENKRLLDVAYTTQFEVNEIALMTSLSACDLFVNTVSPIDANSQTALGANNLTMLGMYDEQDAWLPSHPQAGQTVSAFAHLESALSVLVRSQQAGVAFRGCPDVLTLPTMPMPIASQEFDSLAQIDSLLDEVSLYPSVISQVPALTNLTDAASIPPDIRVVDVVPTILPSVGGQVADLQQDTAQFFGDLLLPQVEEFPFTWQRLYQAEVVDPVGVIRIED